MSTQTEEKPKTLPTAVMAGGAGLATAAAGVNMAVKHNNDFAEKIRLGIQEYAKEYGPTSIQVENATNSFNIAKDAPINGRQIAYITAAVLAVTAATAFAADQFNKHQQNKVDINSSMSQVESSSQGVQRNTAMERQ